MLALCSSALLGCDTTPKRTDLAAYDTFCSVCDDEFPIGLYHGVAEDPKEAGRYYAQLQRAGFNFVHLWEGQDIAAALKALKETGLRAVVHYPSNEMVRAQRDGPTVLGWYLDEEPSYLLSKDQSIKALARFEQRRAEIRAIDDKRPVFIIDGPHTAKVDKVWRQWAVAGDISAHFNYPVTVRKLHDKTPPQRVGATVALARELNESSKPMWFVVQAFGGHDRGWRMPTPAQYRSMVYSAIMQGARGVIVFAYDSFVLRDDGIVGVRPDPKARYANRTDYNNDGKPPHEASPAELEASRRLWDQVVAVNGELKILGPWLQAPADATLPIELETLKGRGRDVRYTFKIKGDRRLLIVQNTGTTEVTLRMSLVNSPLVLEPYIKSDDVSVKAVEAGAWQVQLGAYGVGVVNVVLGEGAKP